MRLAVLFIALSLSGCVANGLHPLRPMEIATAPYTGIVTTALTGSLMYEGGCLMFRDEGNITQMMPVWPNGSTFNGTSVTFHEPGKAEQRIIVNEEVFLEGQPVEWSRVPGARIPLHERKCRRPAFAVLRVHPAN